MNYDEATNWFRQHGNRNETPEQTYARIRELPNSRDWHNKNEEAISVIVRHNRLQTSVRPSLQRFVHGNTSEAPVELDLDSSLSPEAKRIKSKIERQKDLQRERQQRYRARKTAEGKERERMSAAASMAELRAQSRAAETEAQRSQRQSTEAAHRSQRRAAETLEQRSQRQSTEAAHKSQRRTAETPEQRSQRQSLDAAHHSQVIASETPQQRSQRLATVAASMSRNRATALSTNRTAAQQMAQLANIDEDAVVPHYCGPMDVRCQFCGSFNFKDELPSDRKFTMCCQKGKLLIPKPRINDIPQDYPEFLRRLLSDPQCPGYRNFREFVRSYNSSVSFASLGATLANIPGNGPYVFKVQGQTYHLTSHTEPRNANERRSYAQLYVLDSLTQATDIRMQHPAMAECNPVIIRQITEFFRTNNSIARSYQLMHEVQQREEAAALAQGLAIPEVRMSLRSDRSTDERRFNLPTSNEVAMIFVNDDGEPPFHRDIRIYPRNPTNPHHSLFRLNIRSSNLDPMVYAILFPYGQPGWHPQYRFNDKHFTMLQHKSALMAIREEFNPVMCSGKLTQQWIVDSYLQVEAHNLEFIRHNQSKLRSELYQGLADYVNTRALQAGVTAGRPVILPSSFQGSPRNMRERLQDAMSIFGRFGPPDLFVTFTANPQWREIQENLRLGETAGDRADLVDRVFKIKLYELLRDITTNGIFGKSVAHVYTIEFQKRGLPHAHILVVLQQGHKFRSAADIDAVVSAEIPDFLTHPRLYGIVTKQMLHGPCGPRCFGDDGNCTKRFPKDYQERTEVNSAGTGYPAYQRRVGGLFTKNGYDFDNRHVVPFNPFLLLKYNAHINVEICTSLKAIKYIYKYIYKGFDCANCKLGYVDGEQVFVHDEISNYINARYVSPPEGYWRLSCFKMHDRSHAVITLPVHLLRQQVLFFEEGREEEAVEAARAGITKLTAWFALNHTDPDARTLLYTDMPYHYTYRNNAWHKRVRGGEKVIGRMFGVSPREEERFSLRLLLLHIPGATGYDFLRMFNGIQYATFKEAAVARKLLASDEEFDKFLLEAATSQMPYQMRQSFAYLCVFCRPQNANALFEKYINEFILDFVNVHKCRRDVSINLALHQMQLVFTDHGLKCADFGLPAPTGTYKEGARYSASDEKDRAEKMMETFTFGQRAAFNAIVDSIDNEFSHKLFYLNGPGGSGKTYLYQALISFVRGRGQTVNAYASTGIAATLLDGATTIHSGFGLPVPLLDTSTSTIKPTSANGKSIFGASVLILDEITMLNKHGLRVIDKLLREEIMKVEKPFGGKTVVISGDYRQTLPIVPRGNRVDVIQACIISGPLWKHFKNITLTQNMRSAGQNAHNAWLLQLGSGDTPQIAGLSENSVEIPASMITGNDVVNETYGTNIRSHSVDALSERVILVTTNAESLQINHRIIEKLAGDFVTYTSADELILEGTTAVNGLYPVEFLNAQNPSGVPPHKLSLKVGAVVMLIRNLHKKKGLCNGTRLIVRRLHEHYIVCEIISLNHKGNIVFITRLDITPSETSLPFKMKRRQFPLIPAFAITINKSQGQTFARVGIILNEPVFGHGQLYVALSRCKDPEKIKMFIGEGLRQGRLLNDDRWFTENIVFKEIFRSTIR